MRACVYIHTRVCLNYAASSIDDMQLRGSRPPIIEGRFFHSEKTALRKFVETIERCGEHKIMRIRGGRMR